MSTLRFDGRVVVVTGAGAGLGRAYAHLFASRGAKVVVNDLGGSRHGDGNSSKAADTVVGEIKAQGGVAVADYNSVTDGDRVIKTALDNFGRVDVVVNNAGILRDKSFLRISDQDWDLVHSVHLKGSFKTTQAAFPVFKKQGYGRIIMTSSNSGLYGNFGQANYSAAKMGLIGLSNTVAIEGGKYNIHSNVIVPTAGSRLTEEFFPPDIFAELKPELIAPVVAYLCHESCPENGSIIESAAGWAGKCQIVRSNGALLRANITEGVSPEAVKEKWNEITDMSGSQHLSSIGEATGTLISTLEALRDDQQGGGGVGVQKDLDPFTFSSKDVILYNIAIGSTITNPQNFQFLYENHEQFAALPTFYILPAMQALFSGDLSTSIPGNKEINIASILHGEQFIEVLSDLPTEGTFYTKLTLEEALDKGSGAAIVHKVETFDRNGNLLFRNQSVAFAVGAGGWGGPRNGTKIVPTVPRPSRAPDVSKSQKTSLDQAALYRLCGDFNPLHIDPTVAEMGGFKQPILHGLCSLGFSVRLLLEAYGDADPKTFKACKARFMKPVLPGQTLRVDMWKEGTRIHFETVVQETGDVAIGGAYVDLSAVKMVANNSSSDLSSDAIFEFIIDQVKADPQKAKQVGGVFLYNITKDGKQVKQWTMDLANGKVYEGTPQGAKPNTTLTVSDEDFVQMAQGKLQPQAAFMKGKLKISGNIMLAQKLAPILKANAKL